MLIFAAAMLAVFTGALIGAPVPGMTDVGAFFIDLLKMLVVPIAFTSIAGAILQLGSGKKARNLTGKAMGLMAVMSAAGVILGLGLAEMAAITLPGGIQPEKEIRAAVPTFWGFVRGCIPVNPVAALADGNMLQVIVLSIITGAATLCLPRKEREAVRCGFEIAQHLCAKITAGVLRLAPIGVFCLLYPIASKDWAGLASGYASMAGLLILGTIIYMTAIGLPVLLLNGIRQPWRIMQELIPGDVIGAISGGATNYLAPRIQRMKECTSTSPASIDYLLPLMAVLMRAGSCICVGIYTVAAAEAFGVPVTIEQIAVVIPLTIIALTAAPGIIGGTLMDCAIIWVAVGIPLEAVALFAGVDYMMDVLRTVLNIHGGEVVTAAVRGEKEWKK